VCDLLNKQSTRKSKAYLDISATISDPLLAACVVVEKQRQSFILVTHTVHLLRILSWEEVVLATRTVHLLRIPSWEKVVLVTRTVHLLLILSWEEVVRVTRTVHLLLILSWEEVVLVTRTVHLLRILSWEEVVRVTRTVHLLRILSWEEVVRVTRTVHLRCAVLCCGVVVCIAVLRLNLSRPFFIVLHLPLIMLDLSTPPPPA